jgi:hypothetical protein
VHITSIEASLIAAATGRPARPAAQALALNSIDPNDPALIERWEQSEREVIGTPCPFLAGSECSIYEHRPFACRTHLSLDDDDLLCRLVEGAEIPMPRLDTRLLVGLFLSAQPGALLADIREFFAPLSVDEAPALPAAKAARTPHESR